MSDPQNDLFASFANAKWTTADELRAWLVAEPLVALPPSRRRIARELDAFDDLRRLVRSVADRLDADRGISRGQVAALNGVMRAGPQVPLLRGDGHALRLEARSLGDPLDETRAAVARSLVQQLAEGGRARVRRCASETCRWVFIDRSRSGRRRWCDMSVCGNRAKVRRHRARARREANESVRRTAPAGIE